MITDKISEVGWEKHVGADIGGVPPTNYGILAYGDMLVFYTQGPAYADWLAAIHRPVLPNSGFVSLNFELLIDNDVNANAQALEFDFILAQDNFKYNFSSQINYQQGGSWQISDQTGLWVDTGLKPTKLVSSWTPFSFAYRFDVKSKTYTTVSVRIGGVNYMVPPRIHALTAVPTNWQDSASIQIQQDLGSNGGKMSQAMRNVTLVWQ